MADVHSIETHNKDQIPPQFQRSLAALLEFQEIAKIIEDTEVDRQLDELGFDIEASDLDGSVDVIKRSLDPAALRKFLGEQVFLRHLVESGKGPSPTALQTDSSEASDTDQTEILYDLARRAMQIYSIASMLAENIETADEPGPAAAAIASEAEKLNTELFDLAERLKGDGEPGVPGRGNRELEDLVHYVRAAGDLLWGQAENGDIDGESVRRTGMRISRDADRVIAILYG